jgi:MoaA/NifB/PqqE/SkfB family radical SAM enzyme
MAIRFGSAKLLNIDQAMALALQSPKVARNRVADIVFGNQRNSFPRNIVLHLANRCNMACPMCSIGQARADREDAYSGDMPFEIVQKAVTEAALHGAYIDLFGGEPTLYRQLADAIRLIRDHKCLSFITTNGLSLERKAKEFVGEKLNVLLISLDGWDEASQFKRGLVPGSFKKIIDGVAAINKEKGDSLFPIIRISTVITKENYQRLDDIAEVVYRMGVRDWSISNYFFISDAGIRAFEDFKSENMIGDKLMQNHVPGPIPYFDYNEVESLKSSLNRVKSLINGPMSDLRVSFDWDLDLHKYYSMQPPSRDSTCALPYQRVDIFPDGRISICGDGHTIGNIFTGTIKEAWAGDEMRRFREVYEREKVLPMCFRCCGIAGAAGQLKFADGETGEAQH